jgi:hypothetical protein
VSLVLLGAAAMAAAAWQHIRFCRELDPSQRPRSYAPHWSVGFAAVLALAGVMLAVHLVVKSSLR